MASLAGFEFETTGIARTVGAVHLFLAGATNVATGVSLVWLAVSGRLLPAAIDGIGRSLSPATALRYGDLLATLATDGALVAGLALVVLGLLACLGGYPSRRTRLRRRTVVLAVASGVNPLALPPAFVAATLLALSRAGSGNAGVTRGSADATAGSPQIGPDDTVTDDSGSAGRS
jgi:hypothetical protein